MLKDGLAAERKPREPKLYCSSDLIGSLRHSQLKVAGAPRKENELVSDIRLRTGTMWHDYLAELVVSRGMTVMQEVRLSPWLPEGWGGRADFLVWDSDSRAFHLWDIKTVKGEGLRWVSEGAKDEHIWQLSAYWHALRVGRFPLLKKASVFYLPMNDAEGDMEPIIQDVTPLPKDLVWGVMEERWAATRQYLDALEYDEPGDLEVFGEKQYINDRLAPVQSRVQKLFKNGDKYELKLVPHWSSRFCPFEPPLCDCSSQGTTKIGEWVFNPEAYEPDGGLDWDYYPRKGYDHIDPSLSPVRN